LLTSPEPAEETTTTLINLALVVARLGERALLVDGNFHQPRLHSLLRCAVAPGFRDILATPEEWQKGIHVTPVEHLHLIPAGTAQVQTSVSIESPACEVLLAHCRANYDWVLFTVPPILSSTDAALLSTKVDATCLVLTCGVSRLEAALEARAALEAVQGKVIGAILTGRQM
jgi:Mrp family chromosome partitioning ATPase